MARSKAGAWGTTVLELVPKKTRHCNGIHTKYAATARNKKKKPYRGQGR